MKGRPRLVDPQVARTALPAAQDDQSGAVGGLVDRAVDMADDDEVGRIAARRRVGPIDAAGGAPRRRGARARSSTPGPGRARGRSARGAGRTLGRTRGSPSRPSRAGARPGDGRGPAGRAGRGRSWSCGSAMISAPSARRVERAEPVVVIAGHDRQRAALAPELGQGPEARICGQPALGAAGPPSRSRRGRRRSPGSRSATGGRARRGTGGRDRGDRRADGRRWRSSEPRSGRPRPDRRPDPARRTGRRVPAASRHVPSPVDRRR